MADNLTTPLAPGQTIAADEVGGILYPRNKVAFGPDGEAYDVSSINPLPVSVGTLVAGSNSNLFHNYISVATSNPKVIKSSAGRLYGGYVYNSGTETCYFKVFQKATAPVPGTDIPAYIVPVPPGESVGISVIAGVYGLYFATGISYTLTRSYLNTDSPVGADEVIVGIQYV